MVDPIHPFRAGVPPVTRIAKIEPQGKGLPKLPERKPVKDEVNFGNPKKDERGRG